MRFKAKFKKLIRNPALFFKDSYFYKLIRPKDNTNYKIDFFQNMTKSEERKIELEESSCNKEGINKNFMKSIEYTPSGNIIFPMVEHDKFTHLKTIFLYSDEFEELAQEIISKCFTNIDYKPLRKGELICCKYNSDLSEEGFIEILKKIDVKNKDRLSSYPNVFVLDKNTVIAQAIRYANANIISSAILVEVDNKHFGDDSFYGVLDNYIFYNENYCLLNYLRNTYNSSSVTEIVVYIRKILQNNIPREIDLLVPVISDTSLIQNILELSDMKEGVLINLKKGINIKSVNNHIQLCEFLSKNISTLFVKESIYLKYQVLVESPTQENIRDFLVCSSKDGVKFNIKL